jgi:hypothetical protein
MAVFSDWPPYRSAPPAAPLPAPDGVPAAPRVPAAYRAEDSPKPSGAVPGRPDAGAVPPAGGHGQEHTAAPAAKPSAGHTARGADAGVSAVRKGLFRAERGADPSLVPQVTDLGVEHEVRILQLLACTRVATPDQIHAWLIPRAADTSTVRRHLNGMRNAGLTAANTERRPRIWFLTAAGLAEARRAGLAAHRTTAVTGEHVAASRDLPRTPPTARPWRRRGTGKWKSPTRSAPRGCWCPTPSCT